MGTQVPAVIWVKECLSRFIVMFHLVCSKVLWSVHLLLNRAQTKCRQVCSIDSIEWMEESHSLHLD